MIKIEKKRIPTKLVEWIRLTELYQRVLKRTSIYENRLACFKYVLWHVPCCWCSQWLMFKRIDVADDGVVVDDDGFVSNVVRYACRTTREKKWCLFWFIPILLVSTPHTFSCNLEEQLFSQNAVQWLKLNERNDLKDLFILRLLSYNFETSRIS